MSRHNVFWKRGLAFFVVSAALCALVIGRAPHASARPASVAPAGALLNIDIAGTQAKLLFEHLTGPRVRTEGAAGHLYRRGEGVLCVKLTADWEIGGRRVPKDAARRYRCTMRFDRDGRAY